MHQIEVGQILNVAAVERQLRVLWQDSTAEQSDEESVLMRACVANLIVVLAKESDVQEFDKTLHDLSSFHPNRAIVNVAGRDQSDRDIELYVSSFCQSDSRGRTRLTGEEIVLIAGGRFVPELPSAALPLLVPDLPTFLWWHDDLEFEDKTFLDFSNASDRLVIDSVDDRTSRSTLLSLARLFDEGRHAQLGISDVNWARLTSWRALLASFYDPPCCKAALALVKEVKVEYSAPEHEPDEIAPQALLILGWLASRLNWQLVPESVERGANNLRLLIRHENRQIDVQLTRVARTDIKPGRLAKIELSAENNANFVVLRDQRGIHLETQVLLDGLAYPSRILPVRNRSTAQLLSRELEIISNDNIYAEAIQWAANLLRHIDIGPEPSVYSL